jgi:oxygen-independent coproporphyrinogen-3 oxidase
LYIKSLKQGQLPAETEILTPVQQRNEYIMTSIRTDQGIELKKLGTDQARVEKTAARYIETGQVLINAERLWLSKEGKLLADGIAAALFADEDE